MYSQSKLHKNLKPINVFNINGRILNLYPVEGRPEAAAFSLYWNDESNPVQHSMTAFEVFTILSGLLDKVKI